MGIKLMTGLATGAIVGAAVGMVVLPQLDRKTQKKMRKAGRLIMSAAEDTYDTITSVIK